MKANNTARPLAPTPAADLAQVILLARAELSTLDASDAAEILREALDLHGMRSVGWSCRGDGDTVSLWRGNAEFEYGVQLTPVEALLVAERIALSEDQPEIWTVSDAVSYAVGEIGRGQ